MDIVSTALLMGSLAVPMPIVATGIVIGMRLGIPRFVGKERIVWRFGETAPKMFQRKFVVGTLSASKRNALRNVLILVDLAAPLFLVALEDALLIVEGKRFVEMLVNAFLLDLLAMRMRRWRRNL